MDILAAILFGPLGPVKQRVFADSIVRAEIHYRIAADRRYGSGPADPGPSVAAGTLSVVIGNLRRTYDLASILPLSEARIELPEGTGGSCGAQQALARRGHYLAIEVVVAQKGCSATAAFIDLTSGEVAELAVVDHRWSQRLLALPVEFSGKPLRVIKAELVTLTGVSLGETLGSKQLVPWTFGLVRAKGANGIVHLISFGTGEFEPGPAAGNAVLPSIGSKIWVGSMVNHGDLAVLRQMGTEAVVHWTAADDARYAAKQSPTPIGVESIQRYNHALMAAEAAARSGKFDEAVRLLSIAAGYNVGSGLDKMLDNCHALQNAIRAKRMTAAAAGAEFQNDCLPAH